MLKRIKVFFNKPPAPFSRVFQNLTPKDFIDLFGRERYQTIAFILSFCRKRSYVRLVLSKFNDTEFSETVTGYLKRCHNDSPNMKFTRILEEECEKQVEFFTNSDNARYRR